MTNQPVDKQKNDERDYKEVLKSTSLFAFVKVFQMAVSLVRNKLVAMILGPSGIGIIELYSRTTELIKKVAGLGVSQSALRDISAAKAQGSEEAYYKIIVVTRRVVLITSLLGLLLTICFSPLLSKWIFGDATRTVPYIFLSLVVFFTIRTEIQTSILKGVRAQRHLALSNMIGSMAGLFVSVPIYYVWKESGIVAALIINAAVACLCTDWFVNKIKYKKIYVGWRDTFVTAAPMVKVGVLLVAVGVIDSIIVVILSSFLRAKGGLDLVGFYQAGQTLTVSYMGIVASSLVMDYYPRLSAAYNDNIKVADELNKQVKIGLLFVMPLATVFVFFAPQLVEILYTKEFLEVVKFTDIAIFGAVFNILAECIIMILVAKQAAGLYLLVSFITRTATLPVYISLFTVYGIVGLGIAFLADFLLRVIAFGAIVYKKYKVSLDKSSVTMTVVTLFSVGSIMAVRMVNIWYIKYFVGSLLILGCVVYTNHKLKQYLGLSIFEMFRRKLYKNS